MAAPIVLVVGVLTGFYASELIEDQSGTQPIDASTFTASGELRQPVHEHADLAVYARGKRFGLDEADFLSTEENELSKNAHIHAPRTNVIHIHREQTTWDEFLSSLGMALTDECLKIGEREEYCTAGSEALKFFVNGVRIDSLRFQNLTDLSRVLISYGGDGEAEVREQLLSVSDEACIPGEQCSDRVDPANKDQEPCSKSGSSCLE
ncbi:MAG: hypothetical protein ACSLFM_03980 [Tepidiformaceae bacterium]